MLKIATAASLEPHVACVPDKNRIISVKGSFLNFYISHYGITSKRKPILIV